MSPQARLAVVATAVLAPAAFTGGSVAATSPWVLKANAVCTAWHKQTVAALGANPNPRTPAQMYVLMVKARPFEVGRQRALKGISLPKPQGAAHALELAAANIRELDAALAAHRADSNAFLGRAFAWLTDYRAGKAFTAIGARACSS